MKTSVRFYDLKKKGSIKTVRIETFPSEKMAVAAVLVYAESHGFSNIEIVTDEDFGFRVTAKTPGGRSGRNVAWCEPEIETW